jgi:hypothetical protein
MRRGYRTNPAADDDRRAGERIVGDEMKQAATGGGAVIAEANVEQQTGYERNCGKPRGPLTSLGTFAYEATGHE